MYRIKCAMARLPLQEIGCLGNVPCHVVVKKLITVDQAIALEVEDVIEWGINRLEHI